MAFMRIPHWSTTAVAAALLLVPTACKSPRASDPEVWAEVDGKPILRSEVERHYRGRVATGSEPASEEQALVFKLDILDELINNEVLLAHASRARIAVSEAEVDTKMAELQSPYSREEFHQKLKDQGLELGQLRQEVKRSLITNKVIAKEILSRVSLTEDEVAECYERNKAQFNFPETQFHLAQIEVTPAAEPEVRNTKNDDAKNPATAQRKIQALYARLLAGEDFATVALEYSEDARTAAGGGDMGFVPATALDSEPQIKRAVMALKVGQISGILRSSTGYHIVKLLGREEAGQREFTDPHVQSAIRRTLTNEKEQLLKAAFIESLRNRAEVVNYLAERIVEGGGNLSAAQ